MFKKLVMLTVVSFLSSCANHLSILQKDDPYYGAKIKVNQPRDVHPNPFLPEYHIAAVDYKAVMKDSKGIYFAAPTPIIGIDPLYGNSFQNGGLYYQTSPTNKVYLYLVTFAQPETIGNALVGLNYRLIK